MERGEHRAVAVMAHLWCRRLLEGRGKTPLPPRRRLHRSPPAFKLVVVVVGRLTSRLHWRLDNGGVF